MHNRQRSCKIKHTVLGFFEDGRHKRFLRPLHQLDDTFLDGILVLVQPAVDVVLNL